MQEVVGSNPGLGKIFFYKNRLQIPVQRTGNPLYRLQGNPCSDYIETPCRDYRESLYRFQGNPCTDYREYLYRLKGNPFRDYREYLYGLQGNLCKYYRETPSRDYRETPVGYTGILLYRVCTGISCCMYMQVTGYNLITGIPCSDYREKINSVKHLSDLAMFLIRTYCV